MKQLKTMGFQRSDKPFEKRLALLPQDMHAIRYKKQLYFEEGYGTDFDISDEDYTSIGCHVVSKAEVMHQDIVCDPKIGEASNISLFKPHTVIFGWIHDGEHPILHQLLLERSYTCYAWEALTDMGNHVFWKNNQLAGEGAVLHALPYTGRMPCDLNCAILGRGNTAMGAYHILSSLGADVKFYHRKTEALFQKEIEAFDVIVNAVMWDNDRSDYIIGDTQLQRMKQDALIIDVSNDEDGAIQHCHAAPLDHPVYRIGSIQVYAANNIPSLFFKTATKDISKLIAPYVDELICSNLSKTLKGSCIMQDGRKVKHSLIT